MAFSLFDDRQRAITFFGAPKRVISLVPSDTLSVAAIGCASALVGRTDYCELPEDIVKNVPSVGGTKNPRIGEIIALNPDLVIANQEENSRSDLEALVKERIRVFIVFPKRVADGLALLAKYARIFGVASDANVRELTKKGYEAMREAESARANKAPLPTFCPIWMEPLMTIHGSTFISDMLAMGGASNVFAERERRYPLAADLGRATALSGEAIIGRDVRYPRVTREEVVAKKPELVLLPDEPHPFSEEDAEVFRRLDIPAASRGAVARTSGKDLSWYGARSVEGISRVRALVDGFR